MEIFTGILVAFATINIVIGNKENMKIIHDKCLEETGANPEFILPANKGDFADDAKFKCYMKCVAVETGAMNKDGKITYTQEVLNILPPEIREPFHKAVDSCKPQLKSTDPCEKAYEFGKCIYKTAPGIYVIF